MTLLDRALAVGLLRPLDHAFAHFIRAHSNPCDGTVTLAAALVSRAVGQGHSCLDLAAAAGQPSFPAVDGEAHDLTHTNPPLGDWLAALTACPRVGQPNEVEPLILDGHRLYLHRYWCHETELAEALRQRATTLPATDGVRTDRHFPPTGSVDWQAVAAATALDNRLTVIAGGPGTGKTHTVLRLMALLLAQADRPLQIRLAAPTGKAAARITEAIRRDRAALDCDDALREHIPAEAATLHRLLGVVPGRTDFRHDADNPLTADVVVVDECSMVDLPLMARLVRALKPEARLILIGDPDQLASVETGSVLAELCAAGGGNRFSDAACERIARRCGQRPPARQGPASPLADAVVTLEESRRFTTDSAIGRLARAVQAEDAEGALELLQDAGWPDAMLATPNRAQLVTRLRQQAGDWYRPLFQAGTPAEALDALQGFQVLAAVRLGPFGVEAINRRIEEGLRSTGWLRGHARFYRGRPVMVTRNDYRLGLFNGDVGVVFPDPDLPEQPLRVWFRMPNGTLQGFLPGRLGPHETVYAMTIHKSQGSEYDRVLMVLPDRATDFLSRELIYTGLSRARRALTLWSEPAVLQAAIRHRVRRDSGLQARLLNPESGCSQ